MARTGLAKGFAVLAFLAVCPPASATISVAPAPGSPFEAGFRPNGVVAGDLNGDGRDDVVASTGSNPGRIRVFLATPDGSLQMTPASPIATGAGAPLDAIDIADVNGDGKLDVVAGTDINFGADPGEVVVLLGDGAGGFALTAQSPISIGTAEHVPHRLHLVDVTGNGTFPDGKLDIVTANYKPGANGTVSFLQGDGAGGFTLVGTPLLSGDVNVYDTAAVDLNADGRLDLASLHYNPHGVRIRLNSALGYGAAGPLISAGAASARLLPFDLDGDADEDLVFTATLGNSEIRALRNEGNGGLGAYPGFPIETGAQAGYGLELEDLDADGLADIVSSHDSNPDPIVQLSVLTGQAGGAYAPAVGSPFAVPGAIRGVNLAVGDFNGDAQPDFATSDGQPPAGSAPGHIAVMLNQNAGNATPSVATLDFERVDITIAKTVPRTVTFTNTGTGFSRLGTPSISGSAAGDFAVIGDGCGGKTLLRGGTCSLEVAFTPTEHGTRTATLSLPDSPGTQTVALTGRGRDVTKPVLSGLKLSRKRFKVGRKPTARSAAKAGTKIRYRLSEAATVRLTIQRRGKKKKYVLRRKGKSGANSVAFSGRVGKKRLRAGRYRLTVTATDAAGNVSAKRTLRFRIVNR
jgi:FG-GAP-like repeat